MELSTNSMLSVDEPYSLALKEAWQFARWRAAISGRFSMTSLLYFTWFFWSQASVSGRYFSKREVTSVPMVTLGMNSGGAFIRK